MMGKKRSGFLVSAALGLSLLMLACGPASPAGDGAASGTTTVGFLFVGPKDDYGYNQAAYLGSVEMEKAMGARVKVLRAENVPETEEAERVMEGMINQGAKVIFPTSYGHLDPALNVAKRHPTVTFIHQGGLKTAPNLGTYFGNIYETVYLGGVAAGKMTKTNKLGFIVSFPIPQVLMNINAFEQGAKSVNPNATTAVVFTANWCDPGKQAEAANNLIAQGVDVLTQHQDCSKTIVETAERRGIMSVGYHADASALAPKGWLTGAVWNWGPLYTQEVKAVLDGKWAGSPMSGKYRLGIKDGAVDLAKFGAAVPADVQALIKAKQKDIIDGKLTPIEGPVKDQSGNVKIAAGVKPSIDDLEKTDYLVEGVIGSVPR
ncbi:MAG: BMP family ABC transporter substrate-binding protein [Dehalococcoidia bacterium]|nr:BMP family ABC transporter substrate-binding protein [Dehalococcoidia bacterium]